MTLERTDALTQAMRLAQERGLLPSSMGRAELAETARVLRERTFFSARTTNLWYLEKLKALVERYVQGEGYDNDLAQLRVEARELLARAGYIPETGFPGDDELGIPPATPNSLKDLSSEKRLNLIYQTQADMMRGQGKKLRGLARADRWPAWELVRLLSRETPREWEKRWDIAADNVDGLFVVPASAGSGRLIALKTSPIWEALGSRFLFDDALNVDHPPFAFGSGMGWREVPLEEAQQLGLDLTTPASNSAVPSALKPEAADTLTAAEKAAKLARYQKLKAKFDAIDNLKS